jgi:hypothetical protein
MTNTAVEAATPPTTGIIVMIKSWIDSAEPGTTAATTGQRRKSNTDATPDAIANAENNDARQSRKSLKEKQLKFLAAYNFGRANIGQGTRLVR